MAGGSRARARGYAGIRPEGRCGGGAYGEAVACAGSSASNGGDRRDGEGGTGERLMSQFSRRHDVGEKIRVSFEFFPPKNDEMERRLWEAVTRLGPLRPHFVSVTYGAGGSTRERTARTVRRILEETGLTPAAHLTCVDAKRAEVDAVIDEFVAMGVTRFVALRGDPSEGVGAVYRPHP